MQERCIRIVGKTWGIPEEETQAWLDAIAKEHGYAKSGSSEHVRSEDELPIHLSGLETLNMIWDLFETAIQMDDLSERREMLDFAKWMEEIPEPPGLDQIDPGRTGGLERRFCLRITPPRPAPPRSRGGAPFCPL